MHKRNNQSGSAHLIIIAVISLGILGVLGFVFWQKFTTKPQANIQSSTATPSPQAPVTPGSLIDYGKDGIKIDAKNSNNINKLQNAPADFVAYIKNDVYGIDHSDAPAGCSYSDTVTKIYKQTFASGYMGACASGAYVIWNKVEDQWIIVAYTQVEGFECGQLEKYAVPSAIAGMSCNIIAADGSISGTKNYNQN